MIMANDFIFDSTLRWYCVRAKTKRERLAASHLAARYGLEVFCPQIRFQRRTVRGPCWFQEAMFPGYFFARFNLFEFKRAICAAPGVMGLPRFNDRYVPVPDEVIQSISDELAGTDVVDAIAPLAVGDDTTILEGPMRGLPVKVIKLMPAQDRVRVLLEMLGTWVEAEFPAAAVEHPLRHPMAAP